MNKTKQKILIKSLKLFNDNGITNVSLRTIADDIEISVGNLQYHFKKREDIIEALYFELVKKLDGIFLTSPEDLIKSFLDISVEMISTLYDYRFFLLDFVSITRNNPKIKKDYSELSKRRELETLQLIGILIQQGLFREELLKGEYSSLFKRIEIISNFWFSSVLIQADTLSKESIQEYTLLVSQSIYPYLTDEAKSKYAKLFLVK